MMDNPTIKIPRKKHLRGEDDYKTFSVRIRNETADALEELAEKSNRSRNELVSFILEYGVNNSEIIDQ